MDTRLKPLDFIEKLRVYTISGMPVSIPAKDMNQLCDLATIALGRRDEWLEKADRDHKILMRWTYAVIAVNVSNILWHTLI